MEVEKTLRKIREMEAELVFAKPARAGKLASEIVRLKSTIFDE